MAPAADADRPELHPYSNLNASRLKISGSAKFWPVPFLQPNLILPFLEPKVLRFRETEPEEPHPVSCTDSASELKAFFSKWDQQGLLSFTDETHESWQRVRVFNARKNEQHDRQIGDRRSLNLLERRLPGPSSELPPGSLLCQMLLKPQSVLCGAITDRRDFYHQVMVSPEKAAGNPVGPRLPLSAVATFAAGREFLVGRVPSNREATGDGLFKSILDGTSRVVNNKAARHGTLQPCFASLFQGDHRGGLSLPLALTRVSSPAEDSFVRRSG